MKLDNALRNQIIHLFQAAGLVIPSAADSFLRGKDALHSGREHLTASGFVVDPRRELLLLVFNPHLKLWVQPGGHLDRGETPWEGAVREIREETGFETRIDHPEQALIGLNSHPIGVGRFAHLHHDIRFAVTVDARRVTALPSGEAKGIAWVHMDTLADLTVPPDTVGGARKAAALLRRCGT